MDKSFGHVGSHVYGAGCGYDAIPHGDVVAYRASPKMVTTLWRAAEGLLAEDADAFVLLDTAGGVVDRFEPRSSLIEDDLWRWRLRVRGDALLEEATVQCGYEEIRRWSKIVLGGLSEVKDPETRALIEAALSRRPVVR